MAKTPGAAETLARPAAFMAGPGRVGGQEVGARREGRGVPLRGGAGRMRASRAGRVASARRHLPVPATAPWSRLTPGVLRGRGTRGLVCGHLRDSVSPPEGWGGATALSGFSHPPGDTSSAGSCCMQDVALPVLPW